MVVIDYKSYTDILVRFRKGNVVHTSWSAFKKGDVKNVYEKSVYGVGYLGEGKYKSTKIKKDSPQYTVWRSMMLRGYSINFHKNHPSYIDVRVCEEWHNFQNFAQWYDENYYEIEGERMSLDKDILVKGNKIYSPKTCVFVPQSVNTLFIRNERKRGEDSLPIGVHRRNNTFRVKCGNGKGKEVIVGNFKTVEDAFIAYKVFKENIIKQTAEYFKDEIPLNLYRALVNYEVEIDD